MKAITFCSSPPVKRLPALYLTFGLCFWANPLKAQTDFTWDNLLGDGIVTGGVGNWDDSTANWTTDVGVTNVSWVNGAPPNNAIFGGTAGIVTVTAPITLGNLTFNSGYTITGGTLTFGSATPTITANSALGVISSVVAGSSGLSFAATGGIAGTYLDGNNTYTGVTNVNSGFLIARNSGALGGSADGTVVASGATLQVENAGGGDVNIASEAVTISGTGVQGNRGALASWAGNNVWGGSVTMAANSTVLVNSGNLSINGVVSGTGFNLTKLGGGQLTLGGSASNTYTGTTILDNGTLVLGKTAGVPAIVGAVQMGGTTGNQPNLRMAANEQFGAGVVMTFVNPFGSFPRFDLQGTTQTLAGLQDATGAGVIQNEKLGGGGTAAAATLQLNGTGTYSYNGYMRDRDGGAGTWLLNLAKSGSGTQTLSGANITYTGTTTVSSGRLELLNTNAYNSVTTINSGGTLRITNTNASTAYSPLSGTAAIVVNSGGVLELSNSTTTYANRKTFPNAVSGAGTINVIGTGYLALQTVNNITLSGQINVQSGGLGNDGGLSANAFGLNTAALDISAGAFFDLRGGAPQFAGLTGLGSVINSFSANTITIGANGGAGTFAGTIQNGGNVITGTGGAGGSVLSLVKTGAGTQTLSGANIIYTGTTTVNGGRLELFNTTAYNSPTTVNSGVTLRWNGSANIQNNNAGATIALNDGGTLENFNPINFTVINGAVINSGTTTINHTVTAATAGDRGFFLDGGLKGTGTVTINATTAGSGVNLRNNNSTFAGTLIVNGIPNATAFLGSGIGVGGNTTGLANADITLNGTMEMLNRGIGWANTPFGAFSMGALNGAGVMVGNFSGTGGVTTVTMGNTGNAGNFTGTIANGVGNIVVIVKNGTGTQTLSGANITYTGNTTVNAGVLEFVNTPARAGASTINGGTLRLDTTAAVHPAAVTINTNGILNLRTANTAVDANRYTGTITGTGTLVKDGAGWYHTQGASMANFAGTINVLQGRYGNAFNNSVWTNSTADAFVDAGAELDLRTDDMILDQLTGTGSVINTFTVGEINTLTVGIANGSSQFDGIIRGTQTGASNVSIDAGRNALRKAGTGTFTLTGVNTFTGGATVNNGVLRISGGDDRIAVTNVLTVNGGDPTGGVFDLNALNQTVSGLAGGSGVVPGLVTNTTTGTGILTVSGTSTFDGNIQDGGAGKVVGLTKSNNGTLVLTGVNTQTGPTLITGGALRQASATALSTASNIQLNGGIAELGMTDFSDPLGTGGGQIQFLGSGGFGAFGAPRNLNIGGVLANLVWGTGNFVPNGASLILSGPNSNDIVRLQNGLNLNGGAGRITSLGGTAAVDAELAGDISNGTLTLAPMSSTFLVTGLVSSPTVIENGSTITNNMQVVLQRPGGNAINGALQIGLNSATNFATVRLGADQQIADSTVVTFGAAAGKWSYFNLYGFNETIGGLNSLPGMDGGVIQLVEGDASPATNSTLTLNVTSGTQSYVGHIRDRQNGFSNHATAGKLSFLKTGAGTQELATWNNQTWGGTTTVQGGTLRLIMNNGGNLPGAVTVDATGDPTTTLDLAPAGANAYSITGAVSGNGTVVKSGTGTTSFLNSTVSLTGNILVQQGTLRNDGNSSDWSASSANLDVSAGAIFDMRADSVRLNALTGAGLVTNSFGNGFGVFDTLTVGVNGASANFSGNITDGGTGSGEGRGGIGLTKEGAGTQILSGNNTYSGITTVAAGTLQIGNGGTSGSLGTGPVVNNAALVFNRSDDTVAAASISGIGALTKQGNGVLTLNAANTYLGATTIAGGTVRLGASQTMNVASAIWLDAADGATINTGGGGALTSWTNKGSLGVAADAIPVAGLEPTFVSSVPALNNNAAIRFDAAATGGAPFDRIVLPQDYTAGNVTIIYAGRLTGGANQRLVAAAGNNWLLGTWGGNSESAFFNNGFLANATSADTTTRIYTGTIATGGAAEFYVNGVLKGTGGGAQGPNGISLGGGYLNSGTELSDADIGEFLVFNGVLTPMERQQVQDYLGRKWLGNGTVNVLPATTKVTLTNSGAKLDINGVTQSVTGLEGVTGTQVLLGGGALTTGSDNADATFSGNLSGTGNFTKTGTGVQTMGGINTSAGITSLTGGTLLLASNSALSPTSELKLSTGTTLKTNGFSASTGAITLNAGNAVIDMSGGNSTLTFADIYDWSGVLKVWNYDGGVWQNTSNDKLIFAANNFALNLSTVEFYSGAGTGLIGTGAAFYSGSDGQLVPVPEPSGVCAALALLGGIAYRERRTRQRGNR